MWDVRSENAGPMAKRTVRQDPVQIRRAQVTDAETIAGCLSAAFAQHRDEYTAGAYADTVLNSDGVLRRLQEMCLLVAISDGYIVGTIGCMVNGSEGHLRGMAVLPDWQGTGVAPALLQSAEAELKKNGCGYVSLDTTVPLIRAVRFYSRNGYSASGKMTDFFGMPLYEYRKLLL
jgi:GNAT superfamily N-acetyltransferase